MKLYTGDHRYSLLTGTEFGQYVATTTDTTHTHTHTFLCSADPTGRTAVKFDVGGLFMKIYR
jgi:hypothetical protein